MRQGLILAAPSSGSGKTTVTLGILRALRRREIPVRGAKSGPDYIDPRFHEAACGQTCMNLDAWAMSPKRIQSLTAGKGLLVIEGAMGLFDGAPPDGKGATADLARILSLPVVLVVDVAKMAQSVVALVMGFITHDPAISFAGVILNNVGSPRHEAMLRHALSRTGVKVLGAIHRQAALAHPARHLGLVQAGERPDLDHYLDRVADAVEQGVDLDCLTSCAAPLPPVGAAGGMKPPAQRIAIASDQAFAFAYPHLLRDWRKAGAELSFFSPLADQPPAQADMIILPGGYPELHAGPLAAATRFATAMRRAAKTALIYGECGGYMTLGKSLTDANGVPHTMLGLLDLETSFAQRKLHLGYRNLVPMGGPFAAPINAHEFHYATTLNAQGAPLFQASDGQGMALADMGIVNGNVSGSFAHIIDSTN